MGIYLDNGYISIRSLREKGQPFIFITSARGTGKTYGAIKDAILYDTRFVFMRRTATQAEIAGSEALSPFIQVCADLGKTVGFEKVSRGVVGVIIDDELRAYIMALSTMANIRGFQDAMITSIIYDEFIPQPEERLIRHEGQAFLHAYETLNRNRELEGKEPIQVIGCSNSNNILNPIYTELQVISNVYNMIKSQQDVSVIPERGLVLACPLKSPISVKKSKTALYRLSGDSDFSRLSLENSFVNNAMFGRVKSENIKEYVPVIGVGEITIYKHKSLDTLYVTTHRSGSPAIIPLTDTGMEILRKKFAYLWLGYCLDKIAFESYLCEAIFRTYMGKRS